MTSAARTISTEISSAEADGGGSGGGLPDMPGTDWGPGPPPEFRIPPPPLPDFMLPHPDSGMTPDDQESFCQRTSTSLDSHLAVCDTTFVSIIGWSGVTSAINMSLLLCRCSSNGYRRQNLGLKKYAIANEVRYWKC
jgi:hypothetical protein